MFDASRRDPRDPTADSPLVENPPPVSIEVFGRDPLIDDPSPADQPTTLEQPAATHELAPDALPEEPPRASPEQAPAEPASSSVAEAFLSLVDSRLGGLEGQVQQMARQAAFLPPKLRGLGDKLADLAAPLSDARSRAMMVDLLMIDDLVRSGLAADDADAAQRTLTAVSQLMGSVLESHGVVEIETDGRFDPTVHQAVQQLPVDDAEHDGQVLEVYRRGLRTEQRVLRYAEVGVARFVPAPDDEPDDDSSPLDDSDLDSRPLPEDGEPGPASDDDHDPDDT